MIGSGPDHVRRRGPTPGASGCPSGPRADRRRVRRLPHGRRRFKRAGSASWWIDARTKAFEAVARHLPQCRSRRITLKRHRERREEKPMQRRLLLHCAASTGDKLRVNTPAGPRSGGLPAVSRWQDSLLERARRRGAAIVHHRCPRSPRRVWGPLPVWDALRMAEVDTFTSNGAAPRSTVVSCGLCTNSPFPGGIEKLSPDVRCP